jgi:uroporphyrinogen-III synthase
MAIFPSRYRLQGAFASTSFLIFFLQVQCFTPQNKVRHSCPLHATYDRIVVAVTREDGKNEKLLKKIMDHSELNDKLELLELPCIEHAKGPDIDILGSTLKSENWDYVAITSPEAAKVVASAWESVRDKPVPVVAVGKATEKALEGFGIEVVFTPSKATAETLAAELDLKNGPGTTLLYPASTRAKQTLQNGLEERGFSVTRLNTYDTVTANWSSEEKEAAKKVKVTCFASPSSIKGWLKNTDENNSVIAACIGETSAKACRGHNWDESRIFFPDKPGLDGWVKAIQQAAEDIKLAHT